MAELIEMPPAHAGFTEADRRLLTQIEVHLRYLADAIKDQATRADELEQRIVVVERHPLNCPLVERLNKLEAQLAAAAARRDEDRTWQRRLFEFARIVIPLIGGMLIEKLLK